MTPKPLFTGRCYCGALAYRASGDPLFKAQCHCRTCLYFTGGAPNMLLLMPQKGFCWTNGTPREFTRDDLQVAASWFFCGVCGTLIGTTLPDREHVTLRAGTLDDLAAYGMPQAAVRTRNAPAFHSYPAGIPCFDDLPPPQ